MQEEQFNIIRLLRSENIGVRTFYSLKNHFSSVAEIIKFLSHKQSALTNKRITLASPKSIEDEVKRTEKIGGRYIFIEDNCYPENLKFIDDPPPFLVALGNIDLLYGKNHIAVVGARNASFNSLKYTRKITQEITGQNFTTVSGMARGIDAEVHNSSLQNTIAVLPGGIDYIYPPENSSLYKQIMKSGCLVAENPIGAQPSAYNFPQRNRIIAGIAAATVIVEATVKSGSLITAKFAANYNRDVFAVPGFPLDQKFSGNNHLIKNGAYLLDRPGDIFDNLQFRPSNKLASNKNKFTITENIDFKLAERKEEVKSLSGQILDKTSTSPVDVDEISRVLNIPISTVRATILELELLGKIKRVGNNSIVNADLQETIAEFVY